MSIRYVPTLICDGCGTVVESGACRKQLPAGQIVVQKSKARSVERHFCSEACEAWWQAQFPASGPWGPAWDEREWWCEHVGPCAERAHVRTAHDAMPLVDVHAHFEDPEPLGE